MILIAADLHLTDRPKDAYRFGLFDWMLKQQRKFTTNATFILGDITNSKDRHSSKLVNRVIDEMQALRPPVYILRGNHDYIDPANPFFRFLNDMEGIHFINDASTIWVGDTAILLIPHQPKAWPEFSIRKRSIDYIFIHQCVEGAIAESGARLNGLSAAPLDRLGARRVLAGDIHRPQTVGAVAYVGAPYHVRFGDAFKPRVLLLNEETDELQSLTFPAPYKHAVTIREADELVNDMYRPGDQMKITMELTRAEAHEWQGIKRTIQNICTNRKLEVYSLEMKVEKPKGRKVTIKQAQMKTPAEVLADFMNAEKVNKAIRQEGEALLEG